MSVVEHAPETRTVTASGLLTRAAPGRTKSEVVAMLRRLAEETL